MSRALSHTPRVHHPRKLNRGEQTNTINGGSPERSTPNQQRSYSPLAGSVSDCPESCSTSASRPTRDCSPSASRGCSYLASTPPRGYPPSANRGCSHQASTRPGGGLLALGEQLPGAGEQLALACSPLLSSLPSRCSPTMGTSVGPLTPGKHGPPEVTHLQHLSPPLSRSSPLASITTHSSLLCRGWPNLILLHALFIVHLAS